MLNLGAFGPLGAVGIDDFTGDLKADRLRCARWRRVVAAGLQQVCSVNAGSVDFDEHLPGIEQWLFDDA